jgi:hypothetical protein
MRRRAGDVCQLTDDRRGFMLMTPSCWSMGLAGPIVDPARIADFLLLRLRRHPIML